MCLKHYSQSHRLPNHQRRHQLHTHTVGDATIAASGQRAGWECLEILVKLNIILIYQINQLC
ncbi:MAG TPA: hypothetical protein IGS52_08825 [Oscillatoriaceae cyanobacterium M33_DOE_052]|uniref:Uncharacterized protein n=1 Tax=Planktothricoides sp. SpSt-374 TaxID=2282167 RepID=A0A7C3VIT3_9CYAN|nr:hypothetical protein [Oscillatoriaceae cyanobacterium M33_DOE_052]